MKCPRHLCLCLSALKIVWLNSHKTKYNQSKKKDQQLSVLVLILVGLSPSLSLRFENVLFRFFFLIFFIFIFVCFCVVSFFESIVHSLSCTNRHKRSRFSSLLVTLRCWSWKSAVSKKRSQSNKQHTNLRSDSKSKIVSRGCSRIWMVLAVSWSEIVALYLLEEWFYLGIYKSCSARKC